MKKKILVIVMAVFALSLSFAALSQQLNAETSLLDDKIEALACGENGQKPLYQTMGKCKGKLTYACTYDPNGEYCWKYCCIVSNKPW